MMFLLLPTIDLLGSLVKINSFGLLFQNVIVSHPRHDDVSKDFLFMPVAKTRKSHHALFTSAGFFNLYLYPTE
jgi:hypothetical protein